MQREEDRTGRRLDIPVPPKYTSADFLKNSYWRHRGKLDVPKERFISYPYSGPDSDESTPAGLGRLGPPRAGPRHHRPHRGARLHRRLGRPRLIPLVAGLAEVMPWVRQWHQRAWTPTFGQSPADEYDTYLTTQREKYALTDEVLASWSPPAPPEDAARVSAKSLVVRGLPAPARTARVPRRRRRCR